ncbi:MAG: uroporphyrinogen-III synthase [Elainellaceae cyanobacterium]
MTRASGQSSRFSTMLQGVGASVVEMPALEIGPPSTWEPLDRAIAHLSDFDWLILTSANGVNALCDRMSSQGQPLQALTCMKIAVVGKKTATVLAQRGLEPDFIPPNYVADDLAALLPTAAMTSPPTRHARLSSNSDLSGVTVLFPRVESGGRDILVKNLTQRGAKVTEVAAYESGCPKAIAPAALSALTSRQIDIITFASSKTVRCFGQLVKTALGANGQEQLDLLRNLIGQDICIASIGPQTSQACRAVLGRVDIEASEYTLDGLIQALVYGRA